MKKYFQGWKSLNTCKEEETCWWSISAILLIAIVIGALFACLVSTVSYEANLRLIGAAEANILPEPQELTSVEGEDEYKTIRATVTAFNTVEAQTDSSPCISASGDDICGRRDVVACPKDLPLGTRVRIADKVYTCLDRTASKYNGRFDISFDKDISGAINFGKQELEITILDE